MQVTVLSEKISRIRSEILIFGFFQDIRPITGYAGEIDWLTSGSISSLIQQSKIKGSLGEATLVATSKVETPKILLMGLGQKKHYTYKNIHQLSTHVLEILARLRVRESITELWGQEECSLDLMGSLDAFLQGYMGSFSHSLHAGPADKVLTHLTLLTHQADRTKELTYRIREYEHAHMPSDSGNLLQGSGTLRAKTKQ